MKSANATKDQQEIRGSVVERSAVSFRFSCKLFE